MRKRPLGATGLEPSELGLGTWGLSGDAYGALPEGEPERILERALELGIDLFETADSYGAGAMERKLGERLAGHAAPTYVVTKVGTDRSSSPAVKRFEPAYLREAVERSRERLARPKIDVVLLHNPSPSTLSRDDASGTMKALVAEGTIGAWGVSAGDADVARAAIEAGAEVLELAYNAFHVADLRAVEAEVDAKKVAVLARSVLAHGLLTGFWSSTRTFPPDDHRSLRWRKAEIEARTRQVEALRPLLSAQVHTLRAVALRFVLATRQVSAAILGPRTVLQLEQLVREAGAPPFVPEEALARLEADLTTAGVRP